MSVHELRAKAKHDLEQVVEQFETIGRLQAEQSNVDLVNVQKQYEEKWKQQKEENENLKQSVTELEKKLDVSEVHKQLNEYKIRSDQLKTQNVQLLHKLEQLSETKGHLSGLLEQMKLSLEEYKQKHMDQVKSSSNSAQIGRKFEEEVLQSLQKSFGSFATVESVSHLPGHMDLKITVRRDSSLIIYIDTKNYQKTLPNRDWTKFYRDVDQLQDGFAYIMYTSCAIPQCPDGTFSKTERNQKLVYFVGREAFDILLESILDSVVHHRSKFTNESNHSAKSAVVVSEATEWAKEMVDWSVTQTQQIERCWKEFKMLKEKNQQSYAAQLEKSRGAHGACPTLIDATMLALIETHQPSAPKGRPPGKKSTKRQKKAKLPEDV